LGVWVASLDFLFFYKKFEIFCEHALQNKLQERIIFINFGPIDKRLWRNENFGRSLGKVDKCYSQPARIDQLSPKRWVARRKRFEKSLLKVSSLVF
jgi:hypothetical protein